MSLRNYGQSNKTKQVFFFERKDAPTFYKKKHISKLVIM